MTFNVQKASTCFLEEDAFSNCTDNRGLESEVPFTPIVSDAVLQILSIVNSLVINFFVITLGVTTNIINVIVFVKLGFSETTNVSLLALTISDLASLLVKSLQIFMNPLLLPDDLTFNPRGIRFVAMGVPYGWLTLTTSWLTVFIVLERYLCVLTPLKVKTLITPKRSVFAVTTICVISAVAYAPNYYTYRLEWKNNPSRNRTILELIVLADSESVTTIYNSINIFLQVGAFLAVVALTTALIANLAEKSKWRKKAAVSSDTTSHRDRRVAKMIVFICVIFIVCFSPMTTVTIWNVVDPEFSALGLYGNLFSVLVVYATLAEAINSSLNLFVYLKMSTRYNKAFYYLFRKKEPRDGIKVNSLG